MVESLIPIPKKLLGLWFLLCGFCYVVLFLVGLLIKGRMLQSHQETQGCFSGILKLLGCNDLLGNLRWGGIKAYLRVKRHMQRARGSRDHQTRRALVL